MQFGSGEIKTDDNGDKSDMKSSVKNGFKDMASMDWEFINSNTSYATHNFHRYSSKFIPQIAANLIKIFSKRDDTVLDVFAGSGTTLVESKILGRNSIGIDLNPLACLISRVKSRNINDKLSREVKEIFFKKVATQIYIARNGQGRIHVPSFQSVELWFQSQVLRELSVITNEIKSIDNLCIKEFAICALSAIIRSVSNAKSGFGNLMIDKEKRKITNTFELFERQLLKMVDGMHEFNSLMNHKVKSKVYHGDARDINFIKDDCIDLIVTHPPYIASVPYAEYQKLSMNWLGASFPELFNGRYGENIQPRNLDRNIVGGRRGRKDVVERFLRDMDKVFGEMHRALKRNKFCCVVIGNPVVIGKEIELNRILVDIAKGRGFYFEEEIIRGKYKTTMGKMKKEYILIFRKGR